MKLIKLNPKTIEYETIEKENTFTVENKKGQRLTIGTNEFGNFNLLFLGGNNHFDMVSIGLDSGNSFTVKSEPYKQVF